MFLIGSSRQEVVPSHVEPKSPTHLPPAIVEEENSNHSSTAATAKSFTEVHDAQSHYAAFDAATAIIRRRSTSRTRSNSRTRIGGGSLSPSRQKQQFARSA